MSKYEFEKVEVPVGRYIGWGRKGQQVTIKVLSFDPNGGKDYNGNVCPQLVGTLVEPAETYSARGASRDELPAGELVTVTASIVNLKRGLLAANPQPGDIVQMTYTDTYKVAEGDGKVIEVGIARGAAATSTVLEDEL